MGSRQGARFDSNPVRDVFLVLASPTSTASPDDFDGLTTQPTLPFSVPNTLKQRPIDIPRVTTPYLPPASLPVFTNRSHNYRPASLRSSPALPSPVFSTPSPTTTVVHLHPALESFYWDPRRNPPSLSPSKRDSPATEPPLPELALSTGHLPWMVTVRAPSTTTAVTVGDVLDSFEENFRITITRTEWDAAGDRKKRIRQRFRKRCGEDSKELSEGVRRVDYLPDGAVITGLRPYPGAREEDLSIEVVVDSAR